MAIVGELGFHDNDSGIRGHLTWVVLEVPGTAAHALPGTNRDAALAAYLDQLPSPMAAPDVCLPD